MKRKLTIAAGIIHNPQILFLDEPTTGIDVASARQIRQRISDLNAGGTTIFLTTHYIGDAERLCGRLAFIVRGRIARIDTVEILMQLTEGRHIVQFAVSHDGAGICEKITTAFPALECRTVPEGCLSNLRTRPGRAAGAAPGGYGRRGVGGRKVRPSLEDVFVDITGSRRNDEAGKGKGKDGGRGMKSWIAFWNILAKDMRSYYLKPPNVSWGLLFPLVWVAMFFIRSGLGFESISDLLPGVMALSVLFGTTSVHSVTVTFEKKGRSFERLLLAPISLELLMLAKTTGAILFGTVNAFVPIVIALFLTDLSALNWTIMVPAVILVAVSSTFMDFLSPFP
jgi:energy-coupling factor transporter ATP-binding protein EcfA2